MKKDMVLKKLNTIKVIAERFTKNIKSLKIKSLDEIMLMIDSQIKEQNGASTTFKKDTKDFFLNGFTIDSIKDLFKSIEV